MKYIVDQQHDGMLVRDYLYHVRAFSRRMIKVIKYDEGILLNNSAVTVRARVRAGDELFIQFPPEERGPHLAPVHKPISILYEDEDVVVLNKPAALATIPSVHHLNDTLANRLMAYYDDHQIPFTFHVVTRLDRDTSGIVLVAKNRFVHSLLAKVQEEGAVRRTYHAIVEGHLDEGKGTIDASIDRAPGSIIERCVTDTGKRAITHYEVVKKQRDTTLVKVRLETGRTHQIRVHFDYIGHSLRGDPLYNGVNVGIERHALHCSSIQFPLPSTGEEVCIEAPLPPDMESLIKV
ncbi:MULTISPECIES: RluA family pseudouridine synthase [Pontibacillus]|uniref:Pseudouridine synthase n=1 Tax=Pontibacillus chungwhensis TaxID=265426 RepID=A0ABY8V0A3_9BACI|nr:MULTISPECIES: RluA family pseudouridine synthase [Pontibacillus]MCD5324670.1 RluA family pseudouridine synthase [Pontibacillus sp. HN14]WIF99035.1 RluA family pseudouridine synthase [Pontibacillus chungwhensis]